MLSEPPLSHAKLGQAVERLWGPRVVSLRFVSPGGECSWGYRLEADGGARHFLKISQPRVCGTVLVERNLRAADELAVALGRTRIVSALAGVDGRFRQRIGPWLALLLPEAPGRAAMDIPTGLDERQQRQLGALVAQIHCWRPRHAPLPEALLGQSLRDWPRLQEALAAPDGAWDATQTQVAALLRAAVPRMRDWLASYHELEARVHAARHPPVFCHGDPSSGNIIVGPDGSLALIDLDAPAMAPRERDLFHLRLWPAALDEYQRQHAHTPDADLMRRYQLAWDIGEVVEYGWRALMTRQSAAQRRHDLRELRAHLDSTA